MKNLFKYVVKIKLKYTHIMYIYTFQLLCNATGIIFDRIKHSKSGHKGVPLSQPNHINNNLQRLCGFCVVNTSTSVDTQTTQSVHC